MCNEPAAKEEPVKEWVTNTGDRLAKKSAFVEVEFRNGELHEGRASVFVWSILNDDLDIVRFRFIK